MNSQAEHPDLPQRPSCPFCKSADVQLLSIFGQNLLTSQYYCNQCHTAFEAVRWKASPTKQDRESNE